MAELAFCKIHDTPMFTEAFPGIGQVDKDGQETQYRDYCPRCEIDRLKAQLAERDKRIGELEQERDTYKKCSGLAERERLVNVLAESRGANARLDYLLCQARPLLSRSLDLLREVEWCGVAELDRDLVGGYCIWCGCREQEGHSADCAYALHLSGQPESKPASREERALDDLARFKWAEGGPILSLLGIGSLK